MNNLNLALIEESKYFSMLSLMASLSNLYSDSEIPFIHYRITENLFCRYFGALNLSRSDTAYDAKWEDIGIGIKTFIFSNSSSIEKIAEFNSLSPILRKLDSIELALKLADYRNERMEIANRLYGINNSLYHIIGRKKESLHVFNAPYDFVNKENIRLIKNNDKSIHFSDGCHRYSFNKSKSVLMKDFILPDNAYKIDVNIITDPFKLLEEFISKEYYWGNVNLHREQVLLPLFSVRRGIKFVPAYSGLNQWNASGRPRDYNEVYIPIPKSVHRDSPAFFPNRSIPFTLYLPGGEKLNAKVCQSNDKALMSNPNKALGEWILRKVLNKAPGQLVTYQDLEIAGFDSVIISKNSDGSYSLDVSRDRSFSY